MKAKRFVLREKLLDHEDLIIQEEQVQEDNRQTYRNWTRSSRMPKVENKPSRVKGTKMPKISVPAMRCNGTSRKTGLQCRNKTRNQNGYCHHH